MQPALYETLSETPFMIAADPGPLPTFNPNLSYTATHRDTIIREHKEQQRLYDTTTNVNLALKKQLIEAVDEVYLVERK